MVSATTATPPRGANFAGMIDPATMCTPVTPGVARAAASSTDFTVPPTTGGRAMAAYFMPGIDTSPPYIALPVVMSCRSMICTSPLPI